MQPLLRIVIIAAIAALPLNGCQTKKKQYVDKRSGKGASGVEDTFGGDHEYPDQPADPDNPGNNASGDEPTTGGPGSSKPAPAPNPGPGAPKPAPAPAPKPAPAFKSPQDAAVAVCLNAPGSEKRKAGLDYFDKQFQPGAKPYDKKHAKAAQDNCIMAVLPAAIYVNLKSGVPVGTLVGQSIQEAGWCRTSLAQNALNFHGMKKPYSKNDKYKYWDGAVQGGWMKFKHPDYAFYAVAERLYVRRLPYHKCLPKRDNPESFMPCIAKTWAASGSYNRDVLGHRSRYRHKTHKDLTLPKCEVKKNEWRLLKEFVY